MESKLIQITKLKNNSGQIDGLPKNPRILKDDKYKKLLSSIKEDPEMLELREVIAYDNGNELIVIAGNMRLKACREAGIKEVPTKVLPKETTIQKLKRYTIKDNVSFGEWDNSDLANEWDKEELEEWGLDIQFETVEPEAEEDDFEVDEGIQTDIVLGDLFEIGHHRLLCGDSTNIDDVNKLMNGDKADMVFTDPPYGMFLDTEYAVTDKVKGKKYDKVIGDNEDFSPELINTIFACFSYCKEIFLWGADYYAELLIDKNNGSWIVWDKKMESLDASIGSGFELCWSKQKHKRELLRILWSGFTAKEKGETRVHPTQKPIELCTWFIKNHSDNNNIIIDLFGGSGSTMVACHQLNRKCYMSELDPKYVQTIINRMIKLDPTLEIKRNGVPYKIIDNTIN